jgi:hypothetical protein
LGEWEGQAFEWGKKFIENYPDKMERAEAILRFVQQRTEYGFDEDNVVIDGTYQREWAWNGDEVAREVDFNLNIPAIGDCEDLAFFCSAIYEGAGFDTAMVLTLEHAALLIWLPEYPQVLKWDIEGDGREFGWIWVESTGEKNPLGWTPDEFREGYWEAFVVELLYIHNIEFYPKNPNFEDAVTVTASILNKYSKIDEVILRYFTIGKEYEVKMDKVDERGYKAVIPKQDDGITVQFEIEANDQTNHKKTSDLLSYQVGSGNFQIPDFLSNAGIIIIFIIAMIIIFSKL